VSAASTSDKVVVLDRDGTIVVDRGYLADPEGLAFLPGAPEGLRWFYQNGYRLIVITNQSAVGRGMLTPAGLEEIHARFHEMLAAAGIFVEQIYSCPHVPDDRCDCRKPGIGLLLQAATERDFDPSNAVVIGDKVSDVEMGQRVGATTILITGDRDPAPLETRPNYISSNLLEAAHTIRRRNTADWSAPSANP
jgi:D-glycero-D-manno-heptose 1,7-bisphosphate phosphatase